MNFAKTQHRSTKLRTALFAAFVLSAPVLATANTEGALAHNERAAQAVIASSENASARFADTREGTLADNEQASKRVIFDTDAAPSTSAGATGEATLVHNEYAAQRTIVDVSAVGSSTDIAKACAAVGSVTTAC